MAEHDREREEPEAPTQSVLGSLPRGRPGTRSPRRAEAPQAERATPPGADAAGTGTELRGVEDIAWAGVAVAAEAATLGVRLANRALGAMRDAVERP